MPLTRRLEVTASHDQNLTMDSRHRVIGAFKRSFSKLKKLLHCPDRQRPHERLASCSNMTTSPMSTTFSYATTLSTIPEMSELTEYVHYDKALLSPSLYVIPGSSASNSARRRTSSILSVSTISTGRRASSNALLPCSPLSSASERQLQDGRLSYNSVDHWTAFSIPSRCEASDSTTELVRTAAELEMYVPVTSATVRILLT